jgi:nicotinate-nucleotide adenylyltransferase
MGERDLGGRCLFGGTFDPPHVGHLMMAEVARETLCLREVVFMPAGSPPHKQAESVSPAACRLAMTAAALAGFAQFVVSDAEIGREGPSYTVDTVLRLRAEGGDEPLSLLVGADMLADFPNWHRAEELARLVTVVAAPRPGVDVEAEAGRHRSAFPGARVICLDMPALDISSSWIRNRIEAGLRVDPLLPRGVWDLIGQKGIYR